MQDLIRSGQWQVMTTEEQARIKRQMAEGHLSPEEADDDYSGWADEVKKHFSGPVLIAKDLKEF